MVGGFDGWERLENDENANVHPVELLSVLILCFNERLRVVKKNMEKLDFFLGVGLSDAHVYL